MSSPSPRKAFTAALAVVALARIAGLFAAEASGPRGRDPGGSTVFVRVVGTVTVETRDAFSQSREMTDVEIGTGSGFVFTPYGHVLTNHHVIESSVTERRVSGKEVTVRLDVDRVEVALPGDGATRYQASVEAFDPALDLAVLSIAADLPYLPLGDSDAAKRGDTVLAYGFPFGREVEVGRESPVALSDIVPQVSVSRGAVAARRENDAGDDAFLQMSASVNPGNSGGPVVDEDGYVVGVVRMKLRDAEAVSFAVPVNRVKEFLTSAGYDALLPVEPLTLGAETLLEEKGLSLRLPVTLEDVSPSRTRVFTDPEQGAMTFRADRLYTPWPVEQLERSLLGGGTFGSFRASGGPSSGPLAGVPGVSGSASGSGAPGEPAQVLVYAIHDRGAEKLIARYQGPADAVAFNRSILDESLSSLVVAPLAANEVGAPVSPSAVAFEHRPLPAPGAPSVQFPETWAFEPTAPFPCDGAPVLTSALSASPPGDFSVSFRAGFWSQSWSTAPCGVAGDGEDVYRYHVDWLGVRYVVEGVVVNGEGSLQLELVAPESKYEYLGGLAREWLRRNR